MKIKITEETYKRLQGKLLQEDGIVTEKVQVNESHQLLEYDEFFDNVTTKLRDSKKEVKKPKQDGFNTFDELKGNLKYF